jgi:HPt (histidine-containing phosphotransfer) domain-containing protein
LPGIDLASALDRLNHNHKMFRSLLLEFHRDVTPMAQEIRSAMAGQRQKDREIAGRLVHTIRGMAGNLSAKVLFEVASRLEVRIQAGQPENSLLEEFFQSLEQVLESIDHWQHSVPTKEPPSLASHGPVDLNQMTLLFQELSKKIQGKQIQAQKTLEDMKPLLAKANTEILERLEHLGKHLDIFDFEEAQASLATLVRQLEIQLTEDEA